MPVPLLTPYLPEYLEEDSEDGLRTLLTGSISAVRGGSCPYLRPGEAWPRCKTCRHHHVPYLQVNASSPGTPEEFCQRITTLIAENEGARAPTLFQIFVCAVETDNGTCFEGWVNCVEEGESWLVRTVQVDADANGIEESPTREGVRAALGEEGIFLPEQTIVRWMPGNPETEYEAANSDDEFDEELYGEHEPVAGLKLLGYPICGKYYNSPGCTDTFCVEGDSGPHFKWQCLVQLGTQEEENSLYTTGNIYLNQCELHPNVLEAVCSGDW
ncbi:hypothetical protein C8Q79DRAFT_1003548 [Trametes meyenii]|nr:hypothetical protein C8Q79DRAFT_1003548 [Trametes meyenii]